MRHFLEKSPDLVIMVTTVMDCIEKGRGVLSVISIAVCGVMVVTCFKSTKRVRANRKAKHKHV